MLQTNRNFISTLKGHSILQLLSDLFYFMPVLKKFVNEDDESISMEIFDTSDEKIEFYLKNENLNDCVFIDLNYEDIDLIIERLLEVKLILETRKLQGGENE